MNLIGTTWFWLGAVLKEAEQRSDCTLPWRLPPGYTSNYEYGEPTECEVCANIRLP
jgi:hypothetical protein